MAPDPGLLTPKFTPLKTQTSMTVTELLGWGL